MDRILVVISGSADRNSLRQRCEGFLTGTAEIAFCRVLPAGAAGLEQALRAQQELTVILREILGESAEKVAVFTAHDSDGYTVDDCARDWGATIVDR